MSVRKNAMFNMVYRVIATLLPLVTTPYLSRVVGKAGVGLYSYTWAINEMFVIFAMLGLEQYGTRSIAAVRDDREQLNRVFSEIYRMQWLSAGLCLVLWLIYSAFIAG